MPEEINRIHRRDRRAPPGHRGLGLRNSNAKASRANVFTFVGNVMIDTLLAERDHASSSTCRRGSVCLLASTASSRYTAHRTSTIRIPSSTPSTSSVSSPASFPSSSRSTHARGQPPSAPASPSSTGLRRPALHARPLSYRENLGLMLAASVVLTDSGGSQEETTSLGVPCITMRDTHRANVTVELGTSVLVGNDLGQIRACFDEAVALALAAPVPLWDGRASERIAVVLNDWIDQLAVAA
ncbi:MAG: UDP-N-acetylglucosamine 2-epimerase [Acidobacteriota bacterium]